MNSCINYRNLNSNGGNGKRLAQLSLLLLLTVLTVQTYAGYASNAENKIKVALIYKLTKFIEWPAKEKQEGFSICLVGDDSFGPVIDALQKRKVGGQQINIQHIINTDTINDDCRVVYINVSNKKQLVSIIRKLQTRPVLTISDHAQFVELGGIIQFITKNGRMGFNINYDSSVTAGLSIAAPLLELANELKKTNGVKYK